MSSGGQIALRITAEEAQALSALGRLVQAQENVNTVSERGAEQNRKTAAEARALAREAEQMTRRNLTPLEAYNTKLQRTEQAYKDNRISAATYQREVERLKSEYEAAEKAAKETGEAGGKAFGADAVKQLDSYVTGVASAAAGIALAKQALDEMNQAAEQAAASRRGAEGGLAGLAELAGGDPERMRGLVQQARDIYAEGGAADLNEAGQLMFQLESAGAAGERKFFSRLKGVDDPLEMARAAGVMRSAMGEEDTGSFQQIVSKGLGAAGPVPGVNASQMLEGASMAAANARSLGVSDEELLAATSITAQATGSASEAGTKVRALLQAITKQGIGEQLRGQGLDKMLTEIRGKQMGDADLQKFLGSTEAFQAYSLLEPQRLQERVQAVRQAEEQDLAGRTIEVAENVPAVRLARQERQARAKEDLAREREALMNLEANRYVADEKRRLIEESGGSWLGRARAAITGMAAGGFRKIYGDEGFLQVSEDLNTLRRRTTGQSELMPTAEESFQVQRNIFEATAGESGTGFYQLSERPKEGAPQPRAAIPQRIPMPIAPEPAEATEPEAGIPFGLIRPQPQPAEMAPQPAAAWGSMFGQANAWDAAAGGRQVGGQVGMGLPVEEIEQQRQQFEAAQRFAPELIQAGGQAVSVRVEAPKDANSDRLVDLMADMVDETRNMRRELQAAAKTAQQAQQADRGRLGNPDRDR